MTPCICCTMHLPKILRYTHSLIVQHDFWSTCTPPTRPQRFCEFPFTKFRIFGFFSSLRPSQCRRQTTGFHRNDNHQACSLGSVLVVLDFPNCCMCQDWSRSRSVLTTPSPKVCIGSTSIQCMCHLLLHLKCCQYLQPIHLSYTWRINCNEKKQNSDLIFLIGHSQCLTSKLKPKYIVVRSS